MEPSREIERLIDIMAALRDPESGCPWDIKQDFESIKPYTIEEAYEVADAIERKDFDDLCDELGDLLLQVVFHARMAEEQGLFAFGDVVQAVTSKMIRRHPHVFGRNDADTPEAVKIQWDRNQTAGKGRTCRTARQKRPYGRLQIWSPRPCSAQLPALTEALKLQEHAARVGFDWSEPDPILDKFEEEIGELRQALLSGNSTEIADELGDLIFAAVTLGRHTKTDPEQALRGTNTKFRRRFSHIEQSLAENHESLEEATLERMEALWQDAKAIERKLG
nr:nucleoside triphosphate pyrophosphohydrolase [Marinicella sp. W31]MDC2877099.1 nucleoside triphosphate pyrophosphohydrolase [Marinicella sp. W31]